MYQFLLFYFTTFAVQLKVYMLSTLDGCIAVSILLQSHKFKKGRVQKIMSNILHEKYISCFMFVTDRLYIS
ncbi:hypothetical protein BRADI_3g11395v3 [Brachypodium distachyon]|uniref:Uncharacterized protein n=1 Tax=Brachypodium distachyon TaxID=15368 RepID=A0A0Q3F4T8_BRADI|nr:hypothetical protein BRADI_3g11395v3 [Brachypodium distachyon]